MARVSILGALGDFRPSADGLQGVRLGQQQLYCVWVSRWNRTPQILKTPSLKPGPNTLKPKW